MGDKKQTEKDAAGGWTNVRVTLVRIQELPFPFVWTINLRVLDGQDQLPVVAPGEYFWQVNFGVQNGIIETRLTGGTHTVFGDSLVINSPSGLEISPYLRSGANPWFIAAVVPNFGAFPTWDEFVPP